MKLTKDERAAGEALLKILQAALGVQETPDATPETPAKPAAKATKQDAGAINLDDHDDDTLRQAATALLEAGKIDATRRGITKRGRAKLLELFDGVHWRQVRKAFESLQDDGSDDTGGAVDDDTGGEQDLEQWMAGHPVKVLRAAAVELGAMVKGEAKKAYSKTVIAAMLAAELEPDEIQSAIEEAAG